MVLHQRGQGRGREENGEEKCIRTLQHGFHPAGNGRRFSLSSVLFTRHKDQNRAISKVFPCFDAFVKLYNCRDLQGKRGGGREREGGKAISFTYNLIVQSFANVTYQRAKGLTQSRYFRIIKITGSVEPFSYSFTRLLVLYLPASNGIHPELYGL